MSLCAFQNKSSPQKTKYEFTDTRVSQADTLLKNRKYQEALAAYQQAYDQYEAEEFYEGMVYAKERMGYGYRKLGMSQEYNISLNESLRLAKEKLDQNHLLTSKLYLEQALKHYRNRDFVIASIYMDSSSTTFQNSAYKNPSLYLQIVQYKYYTYFFSDRNNDTLIFYLDERDRLFKRESSLTDCIFLLSDYSGAYSKRGDFQRAAAYALEAVRICEENSESIDVYYYTDALFNLGNALNSQKEFERALNVADQLLETVHKQSSSSRDYMAYLNLKAVILNNLGRYDNASVVFEKIISELKNRGSTNTRFYRNAIMNLGVCYQLMRKHDLATKFLFESLESEKDEYPYPSNSLWPIYKYIGQYFASIKNYQMAVVYYDSALRSYKQVFTEPVLEFPPENSIHPSYEFLNLLQRKATHFLNLYYQSESDSIELLTSTLDHVNQVHKYLISNRQDLMSSQGKLFLSENFKGLYETGLDAAYQLYEMQNQEIDRRVYIQNMFNFMSWSKSALFIEQSGELGLIQDTRLPGKTRERYFHLKKNIETLEQRFESLKEKISTNDSIRKINSELILFNTQLVDLVDSMRVQNREMTFGSRDVSLFENVINIFNRNPKRAIVEFFYGRKNIYALTLSKDKWLINKIAIDSTFDVRMQELRIAVSSRPSMSNYSREIQSYVCNSGFLFTKLLEKPLNELNPKIKELTIIPDESLSQVPFEALVIGEKGYSEYYYDLKFLIQKYNVNYALSSTRLIHNSIKRVAKKELYGIGFGDERLTEDKTKIHLNGLAGSEDEIKFLDKQIDGDYFLGRQGNKENFLTQAGKYDILHIAVHGEASINDRYQSYLMFNGENGILKTSDLYIANLSARLAVLSACESGAGQINKGEGTFSIARGFAIVGVPSIVMSLWKVSDQISAVLMKDFYLGLADGYTVSESLRASKLKFLENADNITSHPFYWSSFVALGQDLNIEITNKKDRYRAKALLPAALLILVLLTFVFIHYKALPKRGRV